MHPEESAIRRTHEAWIAAVNAGDLTQLIERMAEDVVLMSPGQPPCGREGFIANFAAALEQLKFTCSSELEEVSIVGDVAYARSRDSLTFAPRAGGAQARLAGHRLTIYRRNADGHWLLARDAHTLSSVPLAQ